MVDNVIVIKNFFVFLVIINAKKLVYVQLLSLDQDLHFLRGPHLSLKSRPIVSPHYLGGRIRMCSQLCLQVKRKIVAGSG